MGIDDSASGVARRGQGLTAADAFAHAAATALGPLFRASHLVLADRRPHVFGSCPSPVADMHFVHWPAWCERYYRQHVASRDPIRRWLNAVTLQSGDSVVRLSELALAPDSLHSPWFDPLLQAIGGRFVLTVALRHDAQVVGAVSLVRSEAAGDFSDADCALAQSLSPLLDMSYLNAIGAPGLRSSEPVPVLATDRLAALTPREREVADLVIAGHPNKSVARLLDTSPWTVKNHLRAVFGKTGVRNRTELCALFASIRAARS